MPHFHIYFEREIDESKRKLINDIVDMYAIDDMSVPPKYIGPLLTELAKISDTIFDHGCITNINIEHNDVSINIGQHPDF